MGMFVAAGARDKLLAHERETFLKDDWPRIRAQIETLGLDLETLLKEPRK
jgi:GntR family transcriptional regulator